MTGGGLAEVANPSALFLAGRDGGEPGRGGVRRHRRHAARCWSRSRRWSRRRRSARRAARWSAGMPSRLAMILAVLEAHGGLNLGAARHLSQRRRRPQDRRARRRSRGGGGADLVPDRRRAAAGHGLFRRDRPFGRGAAGRAYRAAAERSGQARLSRAPSRRRRAQKEARRAAPGWRWPSPRSPSSSRKSPRPASP